MKKMATKGGHVVISHRNSEIVWLTGSRSSEFPDADVSSIHTRLRYYAEQGGILMGYEA